MIRLPDPCVKYTITRKCDDEGEGHVAGERL